MRFASVVAGFAAITLGSLSSVYGQSLELCVGPDYLAYSVGEGESAHSARIDLFVPLTEDARRPLADDESLPCSGLRHLVVSCSQIGDTAISDDEQTLGHSLGLWTEQRRTEDGDELYMVVTRTRVDSELRVREIQTVLQQRLSKRVTRELALGKLECPLAQD